jgi:hypothetical protein
MTAASLPSPLARTVLRLAIAAAAACLVASCASPPRGDEAQATTAQDSQSIAAAGPRRTAAEPAPELPKQDLTGEVLYEFLIAEIAGQRGNLGLSAQAYADLAKRTRDPRVAERATEMAPRACSSGRTASTRPSPTCRRSSRRRAGIAATASCS